MNDVGGQWEWSERPQVAGRTWDGREARCEFPFGCNGLAPNFHRAGEHCDFRGPEVGAPGRPNQSKEAPIQTPLDEFLKSEQLARLLAPVKDEGVVDAVLDRAEKQLAAEGRPLGQARRESHCAICAAGFSMTVAFSFGGWALLDNVRKVPHGPTIAVAFVLVLALGVVTSGFALWALLLRFGHKFPDERDVFRQEALGKPKLDYRKYIAVHLWLVWQDRYQRNEQRAKLVRNGQFLFVGFLLGILLLSVLTTTSAISRTQDPPPIVSMTVSPGVAPPLNAISRQRPKSRGPSPRRFPVSPHQGKNRQMPDRPKQTPPKPKAPSQPKKLRLVASRLSVRSRLSPRRTSWSPDLGAGGLVALTARRKKVEGRSRIMADDKKSSDDEETLLLPSSGRSRYGPQARGDEEESTAFKGRVQEGASQEEEGPKETLAVAVGHRDAG
jgi:hypothetical protein